MTTTSLETLMIALAVTEGAANEKKAAFEVELEAMLQEEEETPLRLRIRRIEERIAELGVGIADGRETARKVLLDEFAKTGDQHPVEGVTIQLRKRLVYSRDEAIGWCQRTDNGKFLDLKLKVRAFEKALRADAFSFEFDVEETPTAALPKDLSQYLPEVDDVLD